MTPKDYPGLSDTARMQFRPISMADAAALYRVWSHPKVTEFLVLEPFRSMEEAEAMVQLLEGLPAQGAGARWTIVERASRRVMGTLGFHNVRREHHRAEIGYEIAPEFWGAGYMVEALYRLLDYCFHKEDMNRIEAFVNAGNERSYRVLEKSGFQREGMLRAYEYARGRFVDQAVFSILKREFPA